MSRITRPFFQDMNAAKTLPPTFTALRATTIAPVSAARLVEAQSYAEVENEHERETVIPPVSVARRLVSATL